MSVIYAQVHLEQTERYVSTRKYMNETGMPLAILHVYKVQVVDFARIIGKLPECQLNSAYPTNGFISLRESPVAGSYKLGKKIFSFIKFRVFHS
jgi:hypothetical protein